MLLSLWLVGLQSPQPETPPPPPAFEGSAELSFVGTTGNSSTQTLGAGVTTIARADGWTVTSKAAFIRNKDRDAVKAQSTAFGVEAGRALTDRLTLRSKYDYQRDRFAGIRHRHTIEAGVAFAAVTTDRQTLSLKAAAGYANERRIAAGTVSTAIATSGLTYALKLSEHATFDNDLAAETSLQDSDDQRLQNVASLTARINATFSLKVKHTMRWVKTPPPGFRKTDTITAVALVATF